MMNSKRLCCLALVAVSGCFEPSSKTCEGGVLCPNGYQCNADGKSCRLASSTCGNKVVDPGEACDDGNISDCDGCSADCQSDDSCGNGVVDAKCGEICDVGDMTSMCTTCAADCKSDLSCGNGVTDTCKGEVCDHGDNTKCDGCAPNCKSLQVCGDGVVDSCKGELCDHGDNTKCDGCAPDCKSLQLCGDGVIDTCKHEICDNGINNAPSAGACPTQNCSADCKSDLTCGNGIVDSCKGELCDLGAMNGQPGAACSLDCKSFNQCGDGVLDLGEECDDGVGGVPTDSATCTKTCKHSYCGDGYANAAAGEACDTSGESITCDGNCQLPVCGNGTVNVTAGLLCNPSGGADTATCNGTSAPVPQQCKPAKCGDAYHNAAASEQCDDGNALNNDDCLVTCLAAKCGDGFLRSNSSTPEVCDDGNTFTETACPYGQAFCTACNATCTAVLAWPGTYCGDGVQQADAGEACDDGNSINETACPYGTATCTGCSKTCTVISGLTGARCGDGTVQADAGETCDDGNTVTETTCPYDAWGRADSTNCTPCDSSGPVISVCGPFCGDGVKNGPEACDDGNQTSGDGCSASCTVEAGFTCVGSAPTRCSPVCGDGLVVTGEACDDRNTNACGTCNATCSVAQPLAKASGVITCIAGSALRDGETVTLSDGFISQVFELVVSSTGTFHAPAAGNIAVDVATTDTATTVASKLSAAIGTSALRVTKSSTAATVTVTDLANGSGGNVPLEETVANTGFSVAGMSGGAGNDCAVGVGCGVSADCASQECGSGHTCTAPTCSDLVLNGSETDTDCGGTCPPCPNTKVCRIDADCTSGVCTGYVCQAPTCPDGVKNQGETDTDCGGPNCATRCPVGKDCVVNGDCASGACDIGNTNTCLATLALTVTAPTGGKVTAPAGLGAGINCGTTCSDTYATGAMVTLTETPNAGFVFSGWGGDCSGMATTATVTMSVARTCTASFTQTFTLTVTNANPTLGVVTSDLAPVLNCGTTCTQTYVTGSMMTLTATPGGGHNFDHWSGGPCDTSTTATCAVTLSANTSMTAHFSP